MAARRRTARRTLPCRRHTILIPEWRRAWKWFSVQIVALIAAAQGLLALVPTLKDYIHPTIWHWLMAGLAILAIIGRIVNQTPKEK